MAKDVEKEKKERVKMLQPVRTKFRKAFKGRIHGNATRAEIELWTIWFKSRWTWKNYR